MNEDARTIYCGNLSSKCNEEILYELFLQAGPLEKVNIPKDRDGNIKTFGFVTYKHEVSVPYAIELFEGTSLFNRQLMVKARQAEQQPFIPKNNGPIMNEISQYGANVLMGYGMPNFAMNMPVNMMPIYNPMGMNMMPYPSQVDNYSHGKDRHSARNQPYSRDRERDRHRERDRDYDRGRGDHHHHQRDSRNHRSNNHHRSGRSYR